MLTWILALIQLLGCPRIHPLLLDSCRFLGRSRAKIKLRLPSAKCLVSMFLFRANNQELRKILFYLIFRLDSTFLLMLTILIIFVTELFSNFNWTSDRSIAGRILMRIQGLEKIWFQGCVKFTQWTSTPCSPLGGISEVCRYSSSSGLFFYFAAWFWWRCLKSGERGEEGSPA